MSKLVLNGDTSGSVTLDAPAVSGTTTLTLPTTSGTVVVTSGAQTIEFADGSASAPSITNSGDTNTGMFFPAADTIAFAEGGVEAMRLDASGNVGIGTTIPSAKLQVSNGNLRLSDGFQLEFGGNNNSISGANASNYLLFYTNNTERMRIDSSGNLFIGTTTNPVSNAVAIINAVVSSGDAFNLKHTVNGNNMFNLWQTGTTTYTAISFSKGDSQTVRGTISVSTSAVAYNTTSDYRLKENIVPMVGALETVTKLKPVTYKWKENDSDGQGFIAHELQEVIPDAVTGEKDAVDAEGKPVYQGVDTSFLVATLTAAIQEQQTIIESLKTDIAALKAKVGE